MSAALPGRPSRACRLVGETFGSGVGIAGEATNAFLHLSVTLHRSLDGHRIVNYIQWQSCDLLHSAHKSPEFRKEWGQFDQLADEIDPHLYEVTHITEWTNEPPRDATERV